MVLHTIGRGFESLYAYMSVNELRAELEAARDKVRTIRSLLEQANAENRDTQAVLAKNVAGSRNQNAIDLIPLMTELQNVIDGLVLKTDVIDTKLQQWGYDV